MTKRRRLTKAEYDIVWQRQLGLCSCGCGEKLEGALPLWLGNGKGLGSVILILPGHRIAGEAAT